MSLLESLHVAEWFLVEPVYKARFSAPRFGGATETHSTPRSTATVLASAAAETEPITVTHTMLAYQVPTLATYSGEGKDVATSPNWHEQLELVAGLCACQTMSSLST